VDIELYLAVTNPNPYGLKLAGYSYDLKVMAFPLAKGGGRDAFDFKGGGSVTELRFPVRVALRSLYEIIKRGPDIDRVPYQLDAGLELETPVGSKTVPINHNGVFSVPERYRPQFYLKQFKNILGGTAQ
jgi:LEA14-like dessication related protein